MTEIKRYEMNHKGLPEPDDKGVWVFHEDHAEIVAALNEKVQALAAENKKLRDWLVSDTMCEVDETAFPVTCSAIRDIRAQGVESYANELRINGIAAKENGHDITADFLSKESSRAAVYAARIRKGEQE